MRSIYFIILALLLVITGRQSAFSQEAVFRKHVEYLASDALKGRLSGTEGDTLAARYIRETLLSYGYKPMVGDGLQAFHYTFIVKRDGKIVRDTVWSFNVAMVLEGSDGELGKESIVVGAHYDHVGLGGPGSGSRRPDTTAIHYGADDNASGVAMLLEIAKHLADGKPRRTVIAAAFGAEEQGIIGSKYFVEHLPAGMSKPVFMLNLDMVGRLNEEKLLEINGSGTFTNAGHLLATAPNPDSLHLTLIPSGYGPSDHTSFYGNGIPVLFFTTGVHYEYHTPADKIETLNFAGMETVYDYIVHVTESIVNAPAAPVYQKAGSETTSGHTAFKVTFGIIPDFNGAYEGDGMRADFVTAGKPADKAGMKNGDIILQIGDKTVHDIQDYMKCLSELQAGETVQLKIRRGEEIRTLIINL